MCLGPASNSDPRAQAHAAVDPTAGAAAGITPISVSPSAPATVSQQVQDQEAARQAAIKAGNANIDSAFAQFNDPYFQKFEDAYKGYYDPQVDSQYADADGTMEAGLARDGIDRSSIAATKHGQLFQAYGDQRAAIGDAAHAGAQELRGKVSAEKGNLYTENAASADPAQANTQALASSTALVTPPAFSPLGQLFGNFLQPFTQFASSYSNNAGKAYVSPFGTTAGA